MININKSGLQINNLNAIITNIMSTIKIYLIIFLSLAFNYSCNNQQIKNNSEEPPKPEAKSKEYSCIELSDNFASYEEAIAKVKTSEFKFQDNISSTNSSWILGASFFSCNGNTGYLIVNTSQREYIHKSVPKDIWSAFKGANSLGQFYNRNIKNHYSLTLQ